MLTLENLVWLGCGFAIGVLVCFFLARSGSWFFSGKIRNLSDKALLDNSRRFMELADTYFSTYVREARKDFDIKGDAIRRTVDPVRQTLDKYETRLNMMEKEREKAYGAISERLMEMGRTQGMLQAETANLVKALRVPHVRGRWGEATLKRVADLAGMAEHCDFIQQLATGSAKGAVRPDMVVTLPGGRNIIVDAKVPLMAYLDALEADNEADREEMMVHHGRQVMQHITHLASKSYFEKITPSPEFVVLFIPGENFFSAALNVYPELIDKGIEKGVILATPTTLIALLKAVAYSWKQKKSYENAEAIRDLGKELFARLGSMTDNLNQLGRDLEKSTASFNRTVGGIQSRVMPAARKLQACEVSSRELAEPVLLDDEKRTARSLVRPLEKDEQAV